MKKLSIIILVLALFDCAGPSSEEANRPLEWIGEWKAEWETPPESPSYAGLTDMEFYMDGKFIFSDDSLKVINNGYPECIFAVDTLEHTQSWRISNDTLVLFNDPKTPGITYRINSFEENRIQLQLMEDIFVTLTK